MTTPRRTGRVSSPFTDVCMRPECEGMMAHPASLPHDEPVRAGRGLSRLWQVCPVCKGSGLVNRPPGVAADQQTFTSTSAGPWGCQTCKGETIILTPGGDDD